MVAFTQIYNKAPDIKEVKNILNTYLSTPYKKTSPQVILKAVADFYNISAADLIKRSRKKRLSALDRWLCFCCATKQNSRFLKLVQKLGGRDHSTVIHACEK